MYVIMTIKDYATFDFPETVTIPYKMNYIILGGYWGENDYFFLNLN